MSAENRPKVAVFTPLDLGRIVKGDRIYGFFVRGVTKTGRMAKLLAAVAELGLPLIHIVNSTPIKIGSPGTFIAFYDFTGLDVSPEKVKEAMEEAAKSMGISVEVEIIEPTIPGFVVDTKHYPLYFLGERAVIFRKTVLEGWFLGVRDRFGSAGEVFLYYEGFGTGALIYEDYVKVGVKREDIWKFLSAAMFAGGALSRMEVKLEEPMTIKIWDCLECEVGKGSRKCFSQWVRGLIAGFASKYFGKKVDVIEVKCIAKGDPYCEFMATIEE